MSAILKALSVILKFIANNPTAIVGLLSFTVAYFAYHFSKKEKKKQKACELAKYYADFIIPRIRFVVRVLEDIEFVDIATEKFKSSNMKRFDIGEFSELWGKAPNIEETYLKRITYETLKKASEKSLFDIRPYCDGTSKTEGIYPHIFYRLVRDLLNDLEAFSMYFNYNIADWEIVYQSLHQVLLFRMPLLYSFISRENYTEGEKCYKNLIWLYYEWEEHRLKKKNDSSPKKVSIDGRPL